MLLEDFVSSSYLANQANGSFKVLSPADFFKWGFKDTLDGCIHLYMSSVTPQTNAVS